MRLFGGDGCVVHPHFSSFYYSFKDTVPGSIPRMLSVEITVILGYGYCTPLHNAVLKRGLIYIYLSGIGRNLQEFKRGYLNMMWLLFRLDEFIGLLIKKFFITRCRKIWLLPGSTLFSHWYDFMFLYFYIIQIL